MLLLASIGLVGWLYLATLRGAFWKPYVASGSPAPKTWPSVDIIVPARDEADSLPLTLPSLLAQNYAGAWRVILVDDHSTDGTGDLARQLAKKAGKEDRLTVIAAPGLPEGWTGKVAAMQAGVAQSNADYILFTDADIRHPTDILWRLVSRAVARKLDLVSYMVKLHCRSFAEMLLIPPFVFFFAMLYPFRSASDPKSKIAAAAGGVMLVRRKALENASGLARIRSDLIDDCALARIIKRSDGDAGAAGAIELSLARDVFSLRAYPEIADIWGMVARTAFTQLNYFLPLLAGTVIAMLVLFAVPLLALLFGNFYAASAGFIGWVAMSLLYLPMLRFYNLPVYWAPTLPFAALIYIAATVDSARLHLGGKGGAWKGRTTVKSQK